MNLLYIEVFYVFIGFEKLINSQAYIIPGSSIRLCFCPSNIIA